MTKYVLGLDQGTTSSRAIVFGHDGRAVGSAQQEFEQILPRPGHVEHDPEAIWASQLAVAKRALAAAGVSAADLAAVGVTNQRETTILWDRDTGKPVANAMVWQSRASAEICERLKADGLEPMFRDKTGLVIDAYFSGTKIKYLLDQIDGLRARAERGEILFGTVDSFLIWRLTGGRRHVTDVSNASRTLIFNLHTLDWDDELLRVLDIPRAMLPEVLPSSHRFGETAAEWFGAPVIDRRRRGGPASGDVRPGVLCAGRSQEHLRHRLFPVDEHRGPAEAIAEQPVDHDRLGTGRPGHVLPGGLGVHRRRGGAVVARRPGADPQFGRGRGVGGHGAGQRRRGDRAGVYRAGRSALGPLRPRRRVRRHPRHDGRATWRGRRWSPWRFRPATCSTPCNATRAFGWTCSRWTAARR